MALHGCLRFMKYVVFLLNFVVWMAGMGVLGLAIYLRMDPESGHYVRAAYHNQMNLYYIVCYLLIGAGVAVTFVGFLGCCGAFQESRCMLGTFFVFLVIIFAAEIAGGVWAFMNKDKIETTVTQTFKQLVVEEYGTSDYAPTLLDDSVDYVQRSLQCCGGDLPTDWHRSEWQNRNRLDNLSKVPESCCSRETRTNAFQHGVCGVSGYWQNGYHPGVWDQACGHVLVNVIQEKLIIIVSIGLGIAGIQLTSLIFSISLCCGMRRQSAGGYKR